MILAFSSASGGDPQSPFAQGREPLYQGACIQPWGALLVVREPDLLILQASANARGLLGFDEGPLGWTLADLGGDLAERLRPRLDQPLPGTPLALRGRLGFWDQAFDVLVHRPATGGLVLELEPAEPVADLSALVCEGLQSLAGARSIQAVCERLVHLCGGLIRYDRVSLFRCDDDADGETLADQGERGLAPELGVNHPDPGLIPVLRRLAGRRRIHLLVDTRDPPVPLRPRHSPLTGVELDLSGCVLRTAAPHHRRALERLGVRSALVVTLVVGGRAWGLLVGCHRAARHLPYATRAVCELLAEAAATRIAALEQGLVAQVEFGVRRFEERMMEAIARVGDWTPAFVESPAALLDLLEASGAALCYEGRWLGIGQTPEPDSLERIRGWLGGRAGEPLVATASLTRELPALVDPAGIACGVLATRIGGSGAEWLIWFRSGSGRCRPWRAAHSSAARLLADSISDVVQQFRAVRVLIAQAQLAEIRSQLQVAEQPILIADAQGGIALLTRSLESLLVPPRRPIRHLDDFVALIVQPEDAERRLRELLLMHQPWRGEIRLATADGAGRPCMLRADAVFFAPGCVLGYVFVLTDLAGREATEAARARLRTDIEGQRGALGAGSAPSVAAGYRQALAGILDNAGQTVQESALGADPARTAELLADVSASVDRSLQLLEHLVRHAGQSGDGETSR